MKSEESKVSITADSLSLVHFKNTNIGLSIWIVRNDLFVATHKVCTDKMKIVYLAKQFCK